MRAGATRVEARTTKFGLQLASDAPALSEEELRSLLDPQTALNRSDRRLSHFGASLQALIGREPDLIEVGSRDTEVLSLEIRGGRGTMVRGGERKISFGTNWIQAVGLASEQEFNLRLTLRSWLVQKHLRGCGREGLFLAQFCRYCSALVVWDGCVLNEPLITGSAKLKGEQGGELYPSQEMDGAAYFLGDVESRGAIPTFPITHGRRIIWLSGDPSRPADWQTLACSGRSIMKIFSQQPLPVVEAHTPQLPSLFCGEKNMIACTAKFQVATNEPTQLAVVTDGIVASYINLSGQRGQRIVIAGNHLSYDLTGLQVILNQEFEKTLEFVFELLRRWRRDVS